MKHLWEINHSYYMNEGNYFSNDCHDTYDTIEAFLSEYEDSDLDYNYVVRFDWIEDEEPTDDMDKVGRLMIQFVGQRKSHLHSTTTWVCRNDEDVIIKFLKVRYEYAMNMWAPFN